MYIPVAQNDPVLGHDGDTAAALADPGDPGPASGLMGQPAGDIRRTGVALVDHFQIAQAQPEQDSDDQAVVKAAFMLRIEVGQEI